MNKFNKIVMCILNPNFYKAYMNGVAPLFELYPLLNQINQIKTTKYYLTVFSFSPTEFE